MSNFLEQIVVHEELLEDHAYAGKTVILPSSGRTLSYSQCGNLESSNVILFYFGIMGSSLLVALLHHLALEQNVRLVAVDYPGVGDSTLVYNRSLQQWSDDMVDFCQQILPLEQYPTFHLMGHSLGGPHALAVLAHPKLQSRIATVTLIAPWVGDPATYPWWMYAVAKIMPYAWSAHALVGSSYLTYPMHYIVAEAMKPLLRVVQECHAYHRNQGTVGTREMVQLAVAAANKEKFWDPIILNRLSEISTSTTNDADPSESTPNQTPPIHIFHGTADKMVSTEAIQTLMGWLHHDANYPVQLTQLEHADHETILLNPSSMAQILQTIVGNDKQEDACPVNEKES